MPGRGAEAKSLTESSEPSGFAKDVAHRSVQHTLADVKSPTGHGNGLEPRVTVKGKPGGDGRSQGGFFATQSIDDEAPAGPTDARSQQKRQLEESEGHHTREDRSAKSMDKTSEIAAVQGPDVGRVGRTDRITPIASETGMEATSGKASRPDAAAASGGGRTGARSVELAQQAGRGAAAKGASPAAKSATGEVAKGPAGAGRAVQDAAGARVESAGTAAKAVPTKRVEALVKGAQDSAKMAVQGAGSVAVTAKEVPSAVVKGAKGAAGVSRKAVDTAMWGARSVGRTGRSAVRTGSWAMGASIDAVQRGALRLANGVEMLLRWWYFLVVQLPYRLAAGSLHMSLVIGTAAASAASRGAVWFLDSATWAGELAYRWLLDGIIRVNQGMDAAISATPPLVKGQLARAAVVEAPEGPHLVDSLSNKSPAQIGSIFRGLTAAAAAVKQEPLVVGCGPKGTEGLGQGGEDLVDQVNAALHAAFDRPDVPVEMEQKELSSGQRQQPQPGSAGAAVAGNGTEALRSVDALRDKLVDQARLMVWHLWMVTRLQLTAAAEVAAVTRGMWSWLLRCVAHLVAALGLLAAMAVAAAGGAVVAAGAWVLASGIRKLRSGAQLEVRARRVWAPLALRLIDTFSAVMVPLLCAPGRKEQEGGVKENANVEKEKQTAPRREGVEPVEAAKGELAAAEAHVSRPKGAAAAAAAAMAPLWEGIRNGQAYARDSLATARQFAQSLVPKDPKREEAEAARAVESFVGLSAVLQSSEGAFNTAWRLAQASVAALTDLTGNLITDVAHRYHISIPKFAWFKGKAAKLAQDMAVSSFARVAGTVPATVVANMVGASPPSAPPPSDKNGAQFDENRPAADAERFDGGEGMREAERSGAAGSKEQNV